MTIELLAARKHIDELEVKVDQLWIALIEYGIHKNDCAKLVGYPKPCDCGLARELELRRLRPQCKVVDEVANTIMTLREQTCIMCHQRPVVALPREPPPDWRPVCADCWTRWEGAPYLRGYADELKAKIAEQTLILAELVNDQRQLVSDNDRLHAEVQKLRGGLDEPGDEKG